MKEYIIIVNGVVSEYDTLAELKAGLTLIADIPAKIYTFKKVHDHLYRLDVNEEFHV